MSAYAKNLFQVLQYVWWNTPTLQSNWSRDNYRMLAYLASIGYISSSPTPSMAGNNWLITPSGLSDLWRWQREVDLDG